MSSPARSRRAVALADRDAEAANVAEPVVLPACALFD
jgi:hypothetical protein